MMIAVYLPSKREELALNAYNCNFFLGPQADALLKRLSRLLGSR